MRRALSAAIIALATIGGTAAISAPAFAAPTSDDPLVLTSDQLTPALDCDKPATLLKDGRWHVVQARHDDCRRKHKRTECLTGPVKHGKKWQVHLHDEKGFVRVHGFKHRDDAVRFAKKHKRDLSLIDCAAYRR
ncbi:hypothetical protein [Nonomuraea cavernae]|uniref:SPOR domain-containing protein n=1 Tax=Nonomuraea cavernae TaxID=2045107 RepID=A0A918DKT5_9ACTN|nr:hypothetical protein [Nonomuraea cavernae]MCA2186301.1 hypothetical protein [Nonomuraea cavernae]GGO69601.1 hypothetical protein GCM10012289_31080 [Nonomuraea cavernae]